MNPSCPRSSLFLESMSSACRLRRECTTARRRPWLPRLAALAVLSLTSGVAAAQQCAEPPAGMVSWWRAEGDGSDQTGAHPLTAQNGATFSSGQVGQAFSLDGANDFLSAPDAPGLRPTSLTIEGWFNYTVTSGGRILVTKTLGSGTLNSFVLLSNGSSLIGGVSDLAGLQLVSFAFTPVAGTWYHIAYVFDDPANTQAIYLDGVLRASASITKSIAYDAHPVTVGAEYTNEVPGGFFAGRADEVTLHGRALSAAEIQSVFTAGTAGKCTVPTCAPIPFGLASWWPAAGHAMDIADSNHGQLQHGASFGPGKVGQAFLLDGVDDAVTVVDSPSLRPSRVTLEGWFRYESIRPGITGLIGKALGSGNLDSYVLFTETPGLLSGYAGNASGGTYLVTSFTPALNTWYHIAYVYDDSANTHRLHVDGVQRASGAIAQSAAYDAHPLVIGAVTESETLAYFLDGNADEVSLYPRALSAAEIQALYNAGSAGKCLPPNTAPELAPIGDRSVDEGSTLSFTAAATDPGPAFAKLAYSLDPGAPAGATIDPASGLFQWTTSEPLGPNDYSITVRVTDNGSPPLEDFETLTVHVAEVNARPVLAPIGDRRGLAGDPIAFTATASDPDLPANGLSFELGADAPAGAVIGAASGSFTWTPPSPGLHAVTVRVRDDGAPALADSETIAIEVGAEFEGLAHYALGQAQLDESQPGRLRVHGKGMSGGDGVRIEMPPGTGALELRLGLPDESGLPAGAWLEVVSRARGAAPEESLGFLRLTHTATVGRWAVTGVVAGESEKILAIYGGGSLLYMDRRSKAFIDAITPKGSGYNDNVGGVRVEGPGAARYTSPLALRIVYEAGSVIQVVNRPDGLSDTTLIADELRYLDPEPAVDSAYVQLEDMRLRCSGIGEVTILAESTFTAGVGPTSRPPASTSSLWLATPAPNPSHDGAVRIAFRLARPEAVRLELLDVTGRCVSRSASRRFDPGDHSWSWAAQPPRSGLYFVRVVTGSGESGVRRCAFLR